MTELDIKYSEKKKFEAGQAQGREEERIEVARKLLAMGLSVSRLPRRQNYLKPK